MRRATFVSWLQKDRTEKHKYISIWWVFKSIISLYFYWHLNLGAGDQVNMERCFGEKERDKNPCWNRLFFIFHFRDNLITIWLWRFYLFCFLFLRVYWMPVYFACSLASFVYLRGNLIFCLSNINLIFSRRPGFFLSPPALLQEIGCRNWLQFLLQEIDIFPFLEKCFLPLLVTQWCWAGRAICLCKESWQWGV